jgi:hypothetical protein
MSINWQDLRPLNSSQNTAFEELCCQLAGAEPAPHGSLFIRKGAPDAGVECYWKLPDGSEWGWQAKFFLPPPNNSQCAQVDKSVKTALDKHPQLSQYVICLPIDRQDPRLPENRSFMDKWNEHVQKWEGWATATGKAVTFEYWGAHELFERLSREEHRGRYYFWFHRDLFSQEWFHSRIEEVIANVDPRYSPELDVQLPIARLFHGLGRTPEFYTRVMGLLEGIRKTLPRRKNTYLPEKSHQLSHVLDRLWKLFEPVQQKTVENIDWSGIRDVPRAAIEIARECEDAIDILIKEDKKESRSNDEIDHLKYLVADYSHLSREMVKLQKYASSNEACLSNLPALLLVGEAGRGKTYLFCNIARHRIQAGMPTVLLIGGQFSDDEPWAQMTSLLGLSCTREEFLGAFEAAAQARNTRAVILIDALNEGQGKVLWKKHLAGILLRVSKSPWLGIAMSVRTSYEDMIRPEGLVPSRLVRAEHYGFADHEYEATKTFFEFFGIQRPSIPLLVPEFQNLLFLKIFCQGLKNTHLTSIPSGLQGITSVFKFFIDSVNKKLADAEYLDFNQNLLIIWRAVEAFAAQLAERGKDWLPLEEAQGAINQILPRDRYQNSLFRHLVAEGVIAENRFRVGDNQWSEGVQFAYERFTDHLIAKYLLDVHLNMNDPTSSFMSDNPLAKYVQDEHACARNRGLIEVFTIQVPERIDKELIELMPSIRAFDAVIGAFIESIIWRHPHSINLDVALVVHHMDYNG